jgi:hypothetical protein
VASLVCATGNRNRTQDGTSFNRIHHRPGKVFLENPDCPFAHVLNRRRQDRRHQTPTVPRRGPWSSNGKGSRERTFGAQSHGFRTRCLRFVVQVAPPHARLASGRWSGATGRAFHPQGFAEGFLICFLHLILPSQAFLAQPMCPKQIGQSAVRAQVGRTAAGCAN